MAFLSRLARQVQGLFSSPRTLARFPRSINTDFSVFQEGDRVFIQGKSPTLTKPLARGQKTDLRQGKLYHDQIIGRKVRESVQAHKGPEYRLSLPTLEEYITLTPRLVTPIYPADANLIVSFLDIHIPPAATAEGDAAQQPPLEILESGTGHGSLTLHLARAIQAANPSPPPVPAGSQVQYVGDRPIQPEETAAEKEKTPESAEDGQHAVRQEQQEQWNTWRAQRNAVIHSVDISGKYSTHAEKIVRGFRRGIYAGNVDFYVGHVERWIAEQTARRQQDRAFNFGPLEPFLSHAILDMPSAHLRLPHVCPVLKQGGLLVVFMPSVTQIGDCMDLIRRQSLPLVMDKVVELGTGISSGRMWDLRHAVRKSRVEEPSLETASETASETALETPLETASGKEPQSGSSNQDVQNAPGSQEDTVLVCRPKVGARVVGGGFVGIWRRTA
ncbi:hypothetical protein ASPZODRAFT_60146 [Penicilliopsis zonata CBS 506.65]|uniref:tRNA (adenine(58)-N(1))-methyltransferase catalytic subunit TRM61 n=1 Tax=Penicilliopsis zonata CBS 506.65 TaxID=1073090 RepID=A0A1L9SPZ0_9EURO|nr:hypothetical protein ASPZODRAFT_60146 [Penicilliopsis zonata CBS 506.65]OJJ49322.1 hypothetical protein ASPZODRAFT_60146 [Penicilliopsis zonata CBS 506.65]